MIKKTAWLKNIRAHTTSNYEAAWFTPDNTPNYHFTSVLLNLMAAIIDVSLVDSGVLRAAMIIWYLFAQSRCAFNNLLFYIPRWALPLLVSPPDRGMHLLSSASPCYVGIARYCSASTCFLLLLLKEAGKDQCVHPVCYLCSYSVSSQYNIKSVFVQSGELITVGEVKLGAAEQFVIQQQIQCNLGKV